MPGPEVGSAPTVTESTSAPTVTVSGQPSSSAPLKQSSIPSHLVAQFPSVQSSSPYEQRFPDRSRSQNSKKANKKCTNQEIESPKLRVNKVLGL